MARISALAAGQSIVTTNWLYLSLHSSDPGATGASEISGGSYARVAPTWSNPVASVTAISGNGTTVTYTTATAHNYVVGALVTITGATTSAYNLVNATIASTPSSTTFTVTNAATGATSTATATSNTVSNTTALAVNLPASTTAAYFGVWTASTSGNYMVGGVLSPSETTGTSAGVLTIAANQLSLNIS